MAFDMERLKQAYGEPPAEFNAAIERALNSITDDEIHKARLHTRYVRIRYAPLAAALLTILIVSTAIGAALSYTGVFKFFNYRANRPVTAPGLREEYVVQKPSALLETDEVVFSIEELLFDGKCMAITVRARANQPDEILLITDYGNDVDDPIPQPLNSGDDAISDETFAQRAARENKRILFVYMNILAKAGDGMTQCMESYFDDGSVTLYAEVHFDTYSNEARTVEWMTFVRSEDGEIQHRASCDLDFVPNIEATFAHGVIKQTSDDFSIVSAEVIQTQLSTYVSLTAVLNRDNIADELMDLLESRMTLITTDSKVDGTAVIQTSDAASCEFYAPDGSRRWINSLERGDTAVFYTELPSTGALPDLFTLNLDASWLYSAASDAQTITIEMITERDNKP